MRSAAVVFFATVLLCSATWRPAQASFIRAQDLYQSCEAFSEFCFGYLAGAYDGLSRTFLNKPKGFCLAQDINLQTIRETYINFARNRPAELNTDGSIVLIKALVSAYPCAQQPILPPPTPQ